MEIKEVELKFRNGMVERQKTELIVIHHTASKTDLTVQEIHQMHLKQGENWKGIGYHYYINKKGIIYRGRPEKYSGSHAIDYNSISIGVCLSGNFEEEDPNINQITSLIELLHYLRIKYPNAEILGHRDLNATACPGKNLYSKLGSIIANSATPDYVKVFMTNNKFSVVQSNGKKFTYNIPKGTTKDDFIADLVHGLKITK